MTKDDSRAEVAFHLGAGEPDISSPAIQRELRELTRPLVSLGAHPRLRAHDADATPAVRLGQLALTLGPAAITGLTAAAATWLQARTGRKVKVKFGDVEAEGATVEEVRQLLELAAEAQARAPVDEQSDKDEDGWRD
ncbi:hypothetical protein [Roseomonas populi]|uniref:Uncharacterized protein n=1 Tax=Roseomonas populi TaxID=3121582 RepID=A0ABT1XCK0_9PROT|nr:hypothetical protein [Roseomonas pecuniae]MCR0985855.1 hypothetical protein [Roseomonas pecuniae]